MTFRVRKLKEEKPPHPFTVALLRGARLMLRMGKPLGTWYAHFQKRQEDSTTEKRRLSLLKKVLGTLACVLIGVLVVAGIVKAMVSTHMLTIHTAFNIVGKELPTDEHGFTNILLLGKGDDDHEGTDLTDSMMIVSLDPKKTKSTVLLSIPRDLYILDSHHGVRGRVNQLYRDYRSILRNKGVPSDQTPQEAMKLLTEEIGIHFGITLHHAVIVNFSAFTKVVDELGGFDINVPQDLLDTEYPNTQENGYITFSVKAGPQHFDGDTALKYVRSRHSTSDFDRSERQQQVLNALREKAESEGILSNPAKIISLWNIVSNNTFTTLSLGELIGLADIGTRIDRSNLIMMQLSDLSGYDGLPPRPGGMLYTPPRDQFDGASVLLPVSIPEYPITYKYPQLFVSFLTQNREMYLRPSSLIILNASGKSGLAYRLESEFTRFGIPVQDTGNAPGPKRDTSVILARSAADRDTAAFFGNLLQIPVDTQLPEEITEDTAMITIILGKDFAYTPFINLEPVTSNQ